VNAFFASSGKPGLPDRLQSLDFLAQQHPSLFVAADAVTARKDDAPAAVQAAIVNVAGLNSSSAGGGLIQTTSG
jgi:hypothetical protein